MRKFYKIFLVFGLSLIFFGFFLKPILAKNCGTIVCSEDLDNYMICLKDRQICELENKQEEAQAASKTLSSAISVFNGQIRIQQLQIEKTLAEISGLEKQIAELSTRIEGLNFSLDKLTTVLVERVREHYKRGYTNPLLSLFSKNRFSTLLVEYKYLKLAQQQTATAMERAEAQKISYDEQRTLKQEKQQDLEVKRINLINQKKILDQQKAEKEALLSVTRNDEKRYQDLIANARAEKEAWKQAQFTGKKNVSQGEILGYMGSTGNSTGPHLHFSVFNMKEDENDCLFSADPMIGCSDGNLYFSRHKNPFEYVKNRSLFFYKNSCYDVGSDLTKNIGSGGVDWPMGNPKITQCYGKTPYSYSYSGNIHRGIDMTDRYNLEIKSIKKGIAYFYRGKNSLGNHVRVYHDDGTMTLYAHMQ